MMVPTIEKLVKHKKSYIERRLPPGSDGKILVSIGDDVKGFDVIAEAEIKPESSDPVSLHHNAKIFKLTAGSAGKVHDIIENKAVLIEGVASFIRALLGFGYDSEGEIKIIAPFDTEVTPEAVNVGHRGKILVGGSFVESGTLAKAEAMGVKGFVCGGVDFLSVKDLNFPLLATEGYGKIPINKEIFDFLTSVELRYVLLSVDRRELVIPPSNPLEESKVLRRASQEKIMAFDDLNVGDKVQVFMDEYFGFSGEVREILKDKVKFESGVESAACKILFSGGDEVVVPIRNMGKLI